MKLYSRERYMKIIRDSYPGYVATTNHMLQRRSGIRHINILDFMKNREKF